MKMQQLNEVWQQHFGSCAPVAHLLRDRFGDRWVRFHSLEESKRYPETEDEMATVRRKMPNKRLVPTRRSEAILLAAQPVRSA